MALNKDLAVAMPFIPCALLYIEHFTANNSTVNLCALDLASAFDRVNHFALFSKLMNRHVPRKFIVLLKCWYDKVFTVVRLNNCFSDTVKLTAGVRQGGVLSPFAICSVC